MKCAIVITLLALLHASAAHPPIQLRAEKADLSERCPATIEIPRWFCDAVDSKERPDWLNTICEAVEPSPKTQNSDIIYELCRQPTIDDRVAFVRMLCIEIGDTDPICQADRNRVEEKISEVCGTTGGNPSAGYPAARATQRGRRSSDEIVDVICSKPRDPETWILVAQVCTNNQQHLLGRLSVVCYSAPQEREHLLPTLCSVRTQVTKANASVVGASRWSRRRAKLSTTTGPMYMYNKEMCGVFMDPRFSAWLRQTCEDEKENVELYGIPRSICEESNPLEVLLRGCSLPSGTREKGFAENQQETVNTALEDICHRLLSSPGYASFVYLVCLPNEMDPERYGIPRSICANLDELPQRCASVGMPSREQMLDSDVEDKREMTKIPVWICNNLSKLGLPDFIGSACKTNDRLPAPTEMCKPSLEVPSVPEPFP